MAGDQTRRNLQRQRSAMKDDTSVIPFHQPEPIADPLTEIAREGARRILATAMEAEIAVFIDQFAEERLFSTTLSRERCQVCQGSRVPDGRPRSAARVGFPGEHCDHLKTTNPIESLFATVRHRRFS